MTSEKASPTTDQVPSDDVRFARRRKRRRAVVFAGLVALGIGLGPSLWVYREGASLVVEEEAAKPADAILVLGSKVYPGGRPSDVLRDRLETALRLYRAGRAPTVLVTGDHAEPEYDEPGAMRDWLVAHGVPAASVVLDGAGLDTYSSMVRAKQTYGFSSIVVVTQRFHLPRALYLASRSGLACEGVVADARRYRKAGFYQVRELASRVRAFLDVQRKRTVPLAKTT